MSNTRLGAYILDQRRTHGLTQQQLATAVGVHQTRVSHWERGSRVPSATQLQALATQFGADVEVLVAEFVVENDVERALIQDPVLGDDDRHALLTLYRSVTTRALTIA